MVISVLERRSEIGPRRALGATKGHIRVQFLAEGVLLALMGGAVAGLWPALRAAACHPPTRCGACDRESDARASRQRSLVPSEPKHCAMAKNTAMALARTSSGKISLTVR
jgi:hypothetical protein